MKVTIDIPEITRVCPFCGIEFDQEMLERFALEDKPANRIPTISCNKTCSLWCAWLRDPGMYRILAESDCHNLADIKRIVARRVATELAKKRRVEKVTEMQKSVASMVLEILEAKE